MDLLKGLNPQQKDAVLHENGPLLILAGAGSGKTRVITTRIAHLIRERHVRPGHILGVTFTNKAANEMKQRVKALAGTDARNVTLCTFHSLGVRILREQIHHLGYRNDFTIYGEGDQQSLVRTLLREHPQKKQKFDAGIIVNRISQYKNSLIDGPKRFPLSNDKYDDVLEDIYKLYQESLRSHQAVDFDDLILLPARLLSENREVLVQYHDRHRHIMVDEYQDTNHGQYRFLSLLAAGHKNLCVVGDDDQSIYSWRGAQVKNILNFTNDYPDAKVIKLEQNYRSTQTILDAANHLIQYNSVRREKKLWTRKGRGRNLDAFIGRDENDEAKTIAWRIEFIKEQTGAPWSDFAVLYRSNTLSRAIESSLRMAKIPYNVFGGHAFFDRKEIKDLVSYLKVIGNPSNDLCLLRIINYPRRGIGHSAIETLTGDAKRDGVPIFEKLRALNGDASLSPTARKGVDELVGLIRELNESAGTMPVSQLVRRTIEMSRYREELERTIEDPLAARVKIEIVEELASAAAAYEEQSENPNLTDFIDSISLGDDSGKTGKQSLHIENAVTLSTLHSAKGLEFPYVFICGMEEDLFPHSRSIGEDASVDEERRLCYVGITRAQEHLTLSLTMERNKFGKKAKRVPSRFLKEIPESLMCKQFSHSPMFFTRQQVREAQSA